MSYSLNEIESLGKRAARGAGLDWGLAEEAGKALRWLVARGLPGPALLAGLLVLHDGRAYGELAPAGDAVPWAAPGGRLSPLLAGPALSDRAADLADGAAIELAETAYPLAMAPYLATAAKLAGRPMTLTWSGLEIVVTPPGTLHLTGGEAQLTAAAAPRVRLAAGASGPAATSALKARAYLDDALRGRLEGFARRTYAPASEASRLTGAGAGLSDND